MSARALVHLRRHWRVLLLAGTLLGALPGTLASAQQLQGELGQDSKGTLGLLFEKRSGRGGLSVVPPGREGLALRLPEAAIRALQRGSAASFPLCIVGSSSNGVSLSQAPGRKGQLTSSTGERLGYEVGIAARPGTGRGAAAADPCNGGTLVDVEVRITRKPTDDRAGLFGVIPILVISE